MTLSSLDFIEYNVTGFQMYWIGVIASNHKWVNIDDGNETTFFKWKDEALNDPIDGYCVAVDIDGYWIRFNCSKELIFVCGVPKSEELSTTDITQSTTPSTSPMSTEPSLVTTTQSTTTATPQSSPTNSQAVTTFEQKTTPQAVSTTTAEKQTTSQAVTTSEQQTTTTGQQTTTSQAVSSTTAGQQTTSQAVTTSGQQSTTPQQITTSIGGQTTTSSNTETPPYTCRSYIPFAYDVSQKLSSDQFMDLRSFLLNPFLQPVFPMDLQPAPFSRYATTNLAIRRRNNVTDIITFVTAETDQVTDTDSDITQ